MLKKWAAQESELAPVKLVLLRNLTCHTLANTNFLLIVNYLAEEKALYQIPFIIAALALLYCYVKTLFTALLFLCAYRSRPLRLLRRKSGRLLRADARERPGLLPRFWLLRLALLRRLLLQLNNFFPREAVLSLTATLLCLVAAGALPLHLRPHDQTPPPPPLPRLSGAARATLRGLGRAARARGTERGRIACPLPRPARTCARSARINKTRKNYCLFTRESSTASSWRSKAGSRAGVTSVSITQRAPVSRRPRPHRRRLRRRSDARRGTRSRPRSAHTRSRTTARAGGQRR